MSKKAELWVDVGYKLFAEEGIEGLQIERLARILGLNKSGFYHYFSDLDGYLVEISNAHKKKAFEFMKRLHGVKSLDPEYLLLLIEFATPVMFQVQAARCRQTHPMIYGLGDSIDNTVNEPIGKLFADFIGMEHRRNLAGKLYFTVRDMFYARATIKDLNYKFLLNLHTEARSLIIQLADSTLGSNPENVDRNGHSMA